MEINEYASGIYHKAGEFQDKCSHEASGKGHDNIVGLWNGRRKVYMQPTIPGIISSIPSVHFGGGNAPLAVISLPP